MSTHGTLSIVGIGPGAHQHTTPQALATIAEAELIVGYSTYIKLVRDLIGGKEVIRTGMTEEIGRARARSSPRATRVCTAWRAWCFKCSKSRAGSAGNRPRCGSYPA